MANFKQKHADNDEINHADDDETKTQSAQLIYSRETSKFPVKSLRVDHLRTQK